MSKVPFVFGPAEPKGNGETAPDVAMIINEAHSAGSLKTLEESTLCCGHPNRWLALLRDNGVKQR